MELEIEWKSMHSLTPKEYVVLHGIESRNPGRQIKRGKRDYWLKKAKAKLETDVIVNLEFQKRLTEPSRCPICCHFHFFGSPNGCKEHIIAHVQLDSGKEYGSGRHLLHEELMRLKEEVCKIPYVSPA